MRGDTFIDTSLALLTFSNLHGDPSHQIRHCLGEQVPSTKNIQQVS
jgi:hypothetical protein